MRQEMYEYQKLIKKKRKNEKTGENDYSESSDDSRFLYAKGKNNLNQWQPINKDNVNLYRNYNNIFL